MSGRPPADLGFRLPAEWEPHEATWLGWPHNLTDWPGKFAPIPWVYAEIVGAIAPGEIVRIIVNSAAHEKRARSILSRVGVDLARVEFFRFPTNRGWTRDFGPFFLRRDRKPASAMAAFRFNAWVKYPDWKKDDAVPEKISAKLKIPMHRGLLGKREIVLEGGGVDVNGCGALLTTEECFLDPKVQVRNPNLGRSDYEAIFHRYFAADQTIWLGRGIAGDDTHGHVDDLCRFVGPETVVLCREKNSRDANYSALEENRERLQGIRLNEGSSLQVVALPMPRPLYFEGRRLPASYANFYITNAAVLVPTFNDPADRVALGILAELITDRPVVGVHAVDLVWGLGTLHCLTKEQTAARSDKK